MFKRILSLGLAGLMLLGFLPAFAEDVPTEASLSDLAARYGFRLGTACSGGDIQWNPNLMNLIAGQFNSMTATNEMKAYSLLDERASRAAADGMPVMNYTVADRMVAWAQEHGVGVRGHVLVWDAYMNDWFFRVDFDGTKPYADSETVRARTRYYIEQVVTHFEEAFPGVVYCWDVVNEAVGDNEGEYQPDDPRHLRTVRSGAPNLFREHLGDDYVAFAFLCARDTVEALGADIRLYYNDYNAYFPEKRAAIVALAESVNSYADDENGAPRRLLDGIGMQGYIGGYGTQEGCLVPEHIDWIRESIEDYAAHGWEVQITEMAVRNFDIREADRHAAFYADLFRMFASLRREDGTNPLVAVSIWGLADNPRAQKGTYVFNLNSPFGGLVNDRLEPKDAWTQVYAVLAGE
ncbi:MAG: endo-1,4-beta-xylanase [Clostridia bacterium]|nr:endo-1,4-beta-xylanase [Clostridia bacterium]